MATLTKEQFEAKYGKTPISATEPVEKPLSNRIAEGLGLGSATDVFGSLLARQGMGVQTKEQGQEFVKKPTAGQVAGAVAQTVAVPAGFALTGGSSVAGQAAIGAGLGYLYDVGAKMAEGKTGADAMVPGVATGLGAVVPPALRGVGKLFGLAKGALAKGAQMGDEALKSPTAQGLAQKAEDIVERVPRFIAKTQETLTDSALTAEKIRTAPPVVQEAYKVGLPEKYINTIAQADDATKQAYRQVLDIADETPTTVGVKKNPTIVGAELATKQYDIIDAQRRAIGQQIGEQVEALGKSNVRADMGPSFAQIDDVLVQNGITPSVGGELKFSGKYTPAERRRIQELYTLSRESGDVLTAQQVRDMDQLFSKLQRETRMEGIGDLRVNANGQDMSMFRMFRDVYANQLENIAPEIRQLNAQYRNLVTLTDDIEDSILKTPNFNVTKSTDPAEFAKVNLRRIFGEAQSSPAYEAIADEMDAISRQLGYEGATPKEIASFAQEVRELYPESVPRTGFQGGFSRVLDVVEKVLGAGKADVTDQRKALRMLLEGDSFKSGAIPPTTKTPTTNPLEAEAKKYKSAEEFVKAQINAYHGTTEKIVGDFKYPLYTTGSKEYANVFANSTAASSIGKSGTKLSNGKAVHEFAINPKARVFDITNPEHAKAISGYWDENSVSGKFYPTERGQLDWTEGENLAQYIHENKLPFDAIKLDEGGGGIDPSSGMKVIEKGMSVLALNKDALLTKSKLTDIWKKANGQ